MSVVVSDFQVRLGGHLYRADLRIALYTTNKSPAVILLEADFDPEVPDSEVLTVASSNVDTSWLTGLPEGCFVAKDWAENHGLWQQLSTLAGESGQPLFTNTGKKVMLSPFVTASIYRLEGEALLAYRQLKGELNEH